MNGGMPQQPLRLSVVMKGGMIPGQELDASNWNLDIDHQPTYLSLHQWAEQHMISIGSTDFQSTLDNFVLQYTQMRTPKQVALPKVSTMAPAS